MKEILPTSDTPFNESSTLEVDPVEMSTYQRSYGENSDYIVTGLPENEETEQQIASLTQSIKDSVGAVEAERTLAYRMPNSYEINGVSVSIEDLRQLRVPGMDGDPLIQGLSAEEKIDAGGILAESMQVKHIAEETHSPIAQQNALATELFAADPAVDAAMEEQKTQVLEAQEIVAHGGDESWGTRQAKKWKMALAGLAGIIAAGAVAPAEASFFGKDLIVASAKGLERAKKDVFNKTQSNVQHGLNDTVRIIGKSYDASKQAEIKQVNLERRYNDAVARINEKWTPDRIEVLKSKQHVEDLKLQEKYENSRQKLEQNGAGPAAIERLAAEQKADEATLKMRHDEQGPAWEIHLQAQKLGHAEEQVQQAHDDAIQRAVDVPVSDVFHY